MNWKQGAMNAPDRTSLVAFGIFTFLCMAGVFALFSQTQLAHTEANGYGPFADPGSASAERNGRTITTTIERSSEPAPKHARDDDTSGEGRDEDRDENVLRLR